MPFKSKAQMRAMAAKVAAGQLPRKVFDEFKAETVRKYGSLANIPEKLTRNYAKKNNKKTY